MLRLVFQGCDRVTEVLISPEAFEFGYVMLRYLPFLSYADNEKLLTATAVCGSSSSSWQFSDQFLNFSQVISLKTAENPGNSTANMSLASLLIQWHM